MSSRQVVFFYSVLLGLCTPTKAHAKEVKGLIPEVRLGQDENENEKKSLQSELMITRAENKALESLQRLLTQRKGQPEEADLWYRLAELHMRRSKSGRFFDLRRDSKALKLSAFPIPNETGLDSIRKAAQIYERIEKAFPQFSQMDSVLFNNAFANQQLGKIKNSQEIYARLLTRFPQSPLLPDAIVALSELLYDQQKFSAALEQLKKIENYPQSRVYSYALYKSAWTYYNMKESDLGTQTLLKVIKINPPLKEGETPSNRHHLRREALRDLVLFVGETVPAKDIYAFFGKVTDDEDELGQSMIDLSKLYESYSRFKDMNIFLNEYIGKNPRSFAIVHSHLLLVQANESIKQREQVIAHLSQASELCRVNSVWRAVQKAPTIEESCQEKFKQTSLEIASKWWDIWLKNKTHKEFSHLTEQAFEVILATEDPKKPDSKTRYAYAELLFQQNKFLVASRQYKIVSEQSTDPKIQHESTYSALFSLEKHLEGLKKKEPSLDQERKNLAQNYLGKYAKGSYARSVQFKLGVIAYEESHFEEAMRFLVPLAEAAAKDDYKTKSEDLILDMHNLKKDYASIKKWSQNILAKTTDSRRKKELEKILQDASFAEIQNFAQTGDKEVAAQKLSEFAQQNPGSQWTQEAQWQSLSLMYSQGRACAAAQQSLQYAQKNPQDKRVKDALLEAAKAFSDCGELSKAADTLSLLAKVDANYAQKHLSLAADLYRLEKRQNEARDLYAKLIEKSKGPEKSELYGQWLATYGETRSPELQKLEARILQEGVEPHATTIVTRKAQEFYDQKKLGQAFDWAMKANSRSASQEARAPARLLQAQILEKELVDQSVKAREEKFTLVLSIKTEKLDKAHTAYFSTLKMSQNPDLQLRALQGIDRCYENYIHSLQTAVLPASLGPQEQQAIRQEINTLLQPLIEKKKENGDKMKQLMLSQNSSAKAKRNYASLSADKTAPPIVAFPQPSLIKAFYPQGKALPAKELESKGKELVQSKNSRPEGLYHLSLAAESRSNTEKALWLIEQCLKMDTSKPHFFYQKARLLYQIEGMGSAKAFFEKALDMQMTSTEMQTFAAIKAYTEGNFIAATENFSRMKKEDLYTYEVGALFGESFAQRGETDKALQVINDLLQGRKDNIDLLLEKAHLLELYKADFAGALAVYEKAHKSAREQDLQEWIERKINYLKNPNRVVQNVSTEDL